jgi:hypothetical protein
VNLQWTQIISYQSQSYVTTDGQSASLSSCQAPIFGKWPDLLLSVWGFVDVGGALWWEGGSLVYSCCWASPVQLFSGPSAARITTLFFCLRLENLQPFGPGRSNVPQEQVSLVILPNTGFSIRCLLRLAGLRWKYSNYIRTVYHRLSKSKLCYDRRSVGQSVLVSGDHLGPATNSFSSFLIIFKQLRVRWCE